MFLGDLIGSPVVQDGRRVGYLNDVRLFVPDRTPGQRIGTPVVHGIVVCPRRAAAFVGYERSEQREPRLLAAFFRWRNRGSFLVLWPDLLAWGEAGVELRPDAQRWSTALS
jgi:hypothetical protein